MNNFRHEYKYIINSIEENILAIKVAGIANPDRHVNEDGSYYIRSLYFDDYNNTCFYENEDGVDPRAKYRIRYYNDAVDFLRLEKKIKISGMTRKESCIITREQCEIFLKGEIPLVEDGMPDIMKSLFSEMRLKQLVPKVIVEYQRMPYVYNIGNVRITFDKNICSSYQISEFLTHEVKTRPVLEKGKSVLEVKWDEVMPAFIKDYLQIGSLQWSNFSKYYLCRKYSLNGGLDK